MKTLFKKCKSELLSKIALIPLLLLLLHPTTAKNISVKDAAGNTQTFSRTWTVSNNDFDLNGTPVDYCDDAMGSDLKIYETGRFRFGMTIDG
jgi:hypothetical protein